MKKCLIISNPDDVHTNVVAEKLNQQGIETIMFYPEDLGTRNFISIDTSPNWKAIILNEDGSMIDLLNDEIVSVWYRRPRFPNLSQFALSDAGLTFAKEEWKHLINGLYEILAHKLWVSHPHALAKCERKIGQLMVAQKLGFIIPESLFTNRLSDLTTHYQRWERNAIVKPIGRGWISEGQTVQYVMTNQLADQHLDNAQGLQASPVQAQNYVHKAYELRITVVAKAVFAAKIDSQKSEVSKVDWRRYDMENTPYTAYELPTEIADRCIRLLAHYGLQFGAIDMIRTPSDEYVFLEINGNGQFLWVEKATDLDISTELALLLACNR